MKCKIRLPKGKLDYFRKKARQAEPKEIQAYLVGRIVSPELVEIVEFAYTKEYADQSAGEVCWFREDYNRVKNSAEERGLTIVGDIHSHPNYWPVLSPDDHRNTITERHRVCGIYATMGRNSKTCFWVTDSSLPCTIIYE